jgi:hypothetical protein
MPALVQNSTLACPRCRTALAPGDFAATHDTACPQCRTVLRGAIFPAFHRDAAEAVPGLADRAGDGEAACFFHAENRAERTCDRCGRFICHVCDMPVGAQRLCPSCLSGALETDREHALVAWRFLWADSALIFGVLPIVLGIFIWPFLVLTGITAIVLGFQAGRRPGSVVRGLRRWAAVLGIVGGVLQVLVWGGMLFFIFYVAKNL